MEYELIVIALTFISLIALYIYRKYKDFPPGPYGLPLVGYIPFMDKEPHITFMSLKKKYGNVFSISLCTNTVVIVNDYKTAMEVLVRQGAIFHGRPKLLLLRELVDGNYDISTATGEIWKQQKRLSMKILGKLGVGRSSLESAVMDEVEKLVKDLQIQDGIHGVCIDSIINIHIFNVLWTITVGKRYDKSDSDMKLISEAFHEIGNFNNVLIVDAWPILRYIAPQIAGYTKVREIGRTVRHILYQEIEKHRSHIQEGKTEDFIGEYIEEIKKNKIGDQEKPPYHTHNLMATVFNFYAAGLESTGTVLSWAILYMIHHPHIQHKVQEELDAVLSQETTLLAVPRTQIPFTEATLNEVQRIAPILPLNAPHTPIQDTILNGYRIPKGTTVMVNLWSLHHDKQYWGDPENFRPERFLDGCGNPKKHDYFLPFSAGPRVCLGETLAKMELISFFSHLMHRFTFEKAPGEKLPTLEPLIGLIRKPQPYSCSIKCRVGLHK